MILHSLDGQRETVLSKIDGLNRDQLAQKHFPSERTRAGLLRTVTVSRGSA